MLSILVYFTIIRYMFVLMKNFKAELVFRF